MAGIDAAGFFQLVERSRIRIAFPSAEPLLPRGTLSRARRMFASRVSRIGYASGEVRKLIEQTAPDVLLTMGWRRVLRMEDVSAARICVNIHPAILPEYKGYHTEPYVVAHGEKEHGITAHVLTRELDAGEIVLQWRFPIGPFATTASLKCLVRALMPGFTAELLSILDSGCAPTLDPDPSATRIVAPRRTSEDSRIDATRPLADLVDAIRACDPERFPAFFEHAGERLCVQLWRPHAARQCQHDL